MMYLELTIGERYITDDGCYIIPDILKDLNSILEKHGAGITNRKNLCTIPQSRFFHEDVIGISGEEAVPRTFGHLKSGYDSRWELVLGENFYDQNKSLVQELKKAGFYKNEF